MLSKTVPVIAFVSLLLASCASSPLGTGAVRLSPESEAGAAAAPAAAEPELTRLAAAIDRLAMAEMEAEHVPGLAVVVVRSGRTILKRGYGVADVATRRPVDPDRTLFRIGSITKALTALAVTRVAADGRLDMNGDVSRYVSGIRTLVGQDRPVTVRDLISHSSGFDQVGLDRHIRETERPLAERKALRPSLRQFLEAGNLRRVTPAGQLFRYDTYGITLAGLVLQQATVLPYAKAMQRELFAPLGMRDSFVEADEAHLEDLAYGYGYVDGAYVRQPYEVYVTTPASSIDATPADMGRLLEALTSDGANSHGRLFDAQTLGAVLAPQFRPQSHCPGATHGLLEGAINSPSAPRRPRTIGHGGNMLGFWNLLTVAPDAQLGIFVVATRDEEAGGGRVRIAPRITDLILEQLAGSVAKPGPDLQPAEAPGDYAAFSGNYFYGGYCRTCTAAEREAGAWSRGDPTAVTSLPRGVRIGEETYLATTQNGVFLREDGERHVCFGRDRQGRISHFNFSTSPDTFERGE